LSAPDAHVVDFPTLWVAADWIENHCVVPDRFERGNPFVLTEWQLWLVVNHYRVKPDAPLPDASRPAIGAAAFHYRRSQVVLPQKSGKGPIAAAMVLLEGCGPTMFAGWSSDKEVYRCSDHGCPCGWRYEYRPGEPMAIPRPTPLIQLTAYSQEQVDNVYGALRPMVDYGPLSEVVPVTGEAFTRLPGNGRIDVVTSSQRSRLGQRVTFVIEDEVGIWLPQNKMDEVAKTQRRGVAGMGGRLVEPLALDTPVPTPTGWSTVGDLDVGDLVFDSAGIATPVSRLTPVQRGEPCYRVTFDDGEQIVASASHGWTVRLRNRKKFGLDSEITLTTEELATRLGRYTASMPIVALRGLPDIDFLVDPYFLGLWLGDGASGDAAVCCAHDVVDQIADNIRGALEAHEDLVIDLSKPAAILRSRLRRRLCRYGHDWADDEMGNGTLRSGRPSVTCGECQRRKSRGEPRGAPLSTMRERLRAIGVLNDKHVPPEYLRASTEQRRALLQGLMDSDGSVAENGVASFVNTNRRLAEATLEIVVSLGHKATLKIYDYPHRGLPAYTVSFRPLRDQPAARLKHKVDRHRPALVDERTGRRFIRSVEPIDSVPVRCIGIDTGDHLFLVGRHATLTHNTTNAWDPSENSVAQTTYQASLKVNDIFRIHPLAPAGLSFTNKAERRRILRHVYAGSPWIDIDNEIEPEAAELIQHDPGNAERFFGNRIVAGLGAWIAEKTWDDARGDVRVVQRGTPVAAGFDGSESDDWTAITLETQDGYSFLPTYGPDRRPTYWDPREWGGAIPRGEVDAAVHEIATTYRLRRLYADPRDWRSEIGAWALEFGDEVVFEFDTYVISRMFPALYRFRTDVIEKRCRHDGHPIVKDHVLNARKAAKPGDKYLLVKPDRARKIDLAMTSVLAHEAAADLHTEAAWGEPSAVRWAVGKTWVR
jgi:hypothetical protein